MTPSKDTKPKAEHLTQRQALAELKVKAKVEANKTKVALIPLGNRIQALIEEYEERTSLEHARRMQKLLRSLLMVVDIGCREAEKDLARISVGGSPCQPSVLRQHLDDLLWDSQ